MKTSSVLLALSLAANLAFAAVVLLRSTAPDTARATSAQPAVTSLATGGDKNSEALRAALASGDVAALQAAGISADVARDIVAGRALARLLARTRADRATDSKWWSGKGGAARNREEQLKAQREFSDALIATFGEDPFFGGNDTRLAFLSPEKREKLRRITQDYDEMLAKFGSDGVQLASDREKQRMLRAARDQDIAALLTPEEFADYQMRTSATAATLRSRYGDAIDSEDDFKKIYALQKAYDDKFPPLAGRITPDMMTARADAARQLQDDLRSTLGDDKYAALKRASDTEVRTLDSLASRLNLPASTTDNILAARETYAQESQRINADTSLTPQQRRAQIQDLGNRARAEVANSLGAEGADAYAQRSSWVSMLQNGMAFSTTPQPGAPGALALAGGNAPSVYPVMPAGVNAARQMVVNGISTTSDAGGGGGPNAGFFVTPAGGGPVQGDNVRVMTFTASSTEGPSNATSTQTTSGGTPGGVIVAPAPAPTPKQ